MHFLHRCGIGDFRRVLPFLIQLPANFTKFGEITDVDKTMNLQHFGSSSADIREQSGRHPGAVRQTSASSPADIREQSGRRPGPDEH